MITKKINMSHEKIPQQHFVKLPTLKPWYRQRSYSALLAGMKLKIHISIMYMMSCPLNEQLRRSTWPTESTLEKKLWGTREELHSTASCIEAWVGAQNLKKPADSSDWRQKLWKSRQATAIMWRHNTVLHDYSGTRYSGTIPITGPYENPPFSYYRNHIECAWI